MIHPDGIDEIILPEAEISTIQEQSPFRLEVGQTVYGPSAVQMSDLILRFSPENHRVEAFSHGD